jgi:hypothetical protein
MSDWVAAEWAECQRHDVRHTKRRARLLGRRSERPVGSLPAACHGGAETVAAERFLRNPDVGIPEIGSGQAHATLARIRAQEAVWLGQDTTFLNDGTTQPKAGRGTVKSNRREESLLHAPVALTPERVPLGGGEAGRAAAGGADSPAAHPQPHGSASELPLAGRVSRRRRGATGLAGPSESERGRARRGSPGVVGGRDAPGAPPPGRGDPPRQVESAPCTGSRAAVCMGREAADAHCGDPHPRTRPPA